MTEKTFSVPDMSCGHCTAAVEGELGRLSGVQAATADLEKGTVAVAYDEGLVGPEQIKSAIEEAGYRTTA